MSALSICFGFVSFGVLCPAAPPLTQALHRRSYTPMVHSVASWPAAPVVHGDQGGYASFKSALKWALPSSNPVTTNRFSLGTTCLPWVPTACSILMLVKP